MWPSLKYFSDLYDTCQQSGELRHCPCLYTPLLYVVVVVLGLLVAVVVVVVVLQVAPSCMLQT